MLQKTPLNSSLIFAQKPNRFDQIVSELSAVETFRWFFFRERSKIVGKWINCPFSLAVWHLLIVPRFYYKNCYCRWQKWDNKTNKYRNAVNRAHKSQFSINFISHFWTKTKQFLAADVFMLAAAVHWKMHFWNLSMALCSVLANAVSVFKFSSFRWKF